MSFFRKSSGYPPLYEQQSLWRELGGLEGLMFLLLVLWATVSLISTAFTHEAVLLVAFPTALSPVDVVSARLEFRPVLFWILIAVNTAITLGGWTWIGRFLKRRLSR